MRGWVSLSLNGARQPTVPITERSEECRRNERCTIREFNVKQVATAGVLVLLVSACTPQAPPPATTSAFDGHYEKPVIVAKSQGCPDLGNLPYVSISNGLALLQALPMFYFQGKVTPQGTLSMRSSAGQTFEGQIDPHFVLNADLSGPSCSYHVTWTRAN
jgi:hypothetical protein